MTISYERCIFVLPEMAHSAKEAARATQLMKKRLKEQEELALRKKKIEEEMKIGAISNKFATHYDAVEHKLKSDTVGMSLHLNYLA